jgi:hypothetical protein
VAVTVQSGILPLAAQIAVASTVFFTSFSSTVLLQVVTSPYVVTLHELLPPAAADASGSAAATVTSGTAGTPGSPAPAASQDPLDRTFRAARYNMFGNQHTQQFTLRDTDKNGSNPFSSFQVKPHGFFYMYGGHISDSLVRQKLTKETSMVDDGSSSSTSNTGAGSENGDASSNK